MTHRFEFCGWIALATFAAAGCASPYYADRGALAGGLGGAGVGALIGEATGNAGPGAIIGAGVGALGGGLVGGALDDVEARNQAQIAAATAQPAIPPGVSLNDVLGMTRSGVDEDLIVNHIRANGVARPLQASELVALQQQGVSKKIIEAMQTSPPPQITRGVGGTMIVPAPAPVIVGDYFYPVPPPPPPPVWWGYYGYGPRHRGPHSTVGFSFTN